MIVGIEGGLSQGKTLVMTDLLKREHVQLGKPLYVNYTLRRLPHQPVDMQWLLDAQMSHFQFDQGHGAAIGLDEMHILMDSRTSVTKRNRLVSYFLLQTAKEGINLYYTTQDFGQVDKRLRQRTDLAVTVTKQKNLHKCLLVDRTTPENKVRRFGIDGSRVWDEYYTKEVIRVA